MTEGETTTETPTTGAEPVDEEVLNRFEDMFNARFTDADEMFQEYVANKGGRVPPILNHYQVMRPRNQRGGYGRGFYNNRRGMKRSYDGGDWYGNDGKQRWHQENYNRQGWGGGGYNRGGYGGGYGNQGGYGYNQGYGNQGYGRGGYGGGGGGGYRGRGGYGGGYRGGYQGQGGYQQQDRWGGNRGGGRFQRGGGQQRKWEDY